jgi:hypothetical protein
MRAVTTGSGGYVTLCPQPDSSSALPEKKCFIILGGTVVDVGTTPYTVKGSMYPSGQTYFVRVQLLPGTRIYSRAEDARGADVLKPATQNLDWYWIDRRFLQFIGNTPQVQAPPPPPPPYVPPPPPPPPPKPSVALAASIGVIVLGLGLALTHGAALPRAGVPLLGVASRRARRYRTLGGRL